MEFTLKEILKVVYEVTWSLGMSDRELVLNKFADYLQDKFEIKEEDLKKEFEALGVPLWERQDEPEPEPEEDEGEPEYGECGFRCDGHCQTCDPGYLQRMRYGTYDGADEI